MKTNYYLIILLYILASLPILFAESLFFFFIKKIGIGSQIGILLPFFFTIILSIVATIALIKSIELAKINNALLGVLVPAIFVICYSLVNPIYPEDFENRFVSFSLNEYPIDQLTSHSNSSITCFFLISCPFCEKAAANLDAMYKNGGLKDIEIIYYAYQNTADSLVKTNSISIPYSVISDDSFFNLGGKSFPSILLREDDEIKFWTGNDVNYACFDYLVNQ